MRRLFDSRGFVFLLATLAFTLTEPTLGQEQDQVTTTTVGVSSFEGAQAGVRKYVLTGTRGTFHLIGRNGTAHYRLKHNHSGCCCPGKWYLTRLRDEKFDDHFLYYEPIWSSDLNTESWAFARRPSFSWYYAVWRNTRGGWKHFGYFWLQVPN